jgi:hypothetical protein
MLMAAKEPVTGTDFYRKKGYVKSLNIHLTEKLYEVLRERAFKEKSSLQIAARKALERGLQK